MYGTRLKLCRLEKGLTQADLAKLLSTTQSTIGKYEREELTPDYDMIIKICKIFDISADYFIGLEN